MKTISPQSYREDNFHHRVTEDTERRQMNKERPPSSFSALSAFCLSSVSSVTLWLTFFLQTNLRPSEQFPHRAPQWRTSRQMILSGPRR